VSFPVSRNMNSIEFLKETKKTLKNKKIALNCNVISYIKRLKNSCRRYSEYQTKVDDCRVMHRVWWNMITFVQWYCSSRGVYIRDSVYWETPNVQYIAGVEGSGLLGSSRTQTPLTMNALRFFQTRYLLNYRHRAQHPGRPEPCNANT
jgi:hypothetical protein